MQNKNRKEARFEVVFREVEKLVICNSSRYLMTIRILVTMATCKANFNEDISFSLPEPPEKPEDRDCCGNGCTPCVFDIYEEEVCKWRKECERIKSGETLGDSLQSADGDEILSTSEFHSFILESVTKLTTDSCMYRFRVPKHKTLGLHIGQHLILRWDFYFTLVTEEDFKKALIVTKRYQLLHYDSGCFSWNNNYQKVTRQRFNTTYHLAEKEYIALKS